ncbi:outer membrane biogenesis protein BamB [Rubripirellula tenax]|uniref:Outer membrane biogenesis protein BamB n=1 Tax=Rubripirellula tenax TaxID=2528015 RepID=A0A5C6EQ90_9BACT|nr:PQQ-binding-like beta-propeller repeat protein [Rubripirellula tenax]TWU50534.1 outer membrane biogenesis protein BamB [Rubripirellula tenax]
MLSFGFSLRVSAIASICFACWTSCALADGSWPQFRGASGDGIVASQSVPTAFGEDQNVTWKTGLPGRAWSSPVIADGTIWVTTAVERAATDEERLEMMRASGIEEKKMKQLAIAKAIELKLISVDLESGSVVSSTDLAVIEKPDAIHSLNSYASPTPVIDGDSLYCHFGTYGTFRVDRKSGEVVWQRRLPLEHGVGPGSSPLVHGDVLVLIQDGMDRQYVTGLNKRTGETIWEADRPPFENATPDTSKSYCTPIVITDSAGREQLICMGAQWIVAYEAKTGNEIWRLRHGKGFSVVPRPLFQDDVVFFSTGFGKPELWAVRVDGSGDVTDSHVEWTTAQGIPARPSMVLHDNRLYMVSDNGVASSKSAVDGEEFWKERLGGDYSASPTLIGGLIYFGSHDGKVTIVKPGDEPEIVAVNELDGKIMASPAVIDGALIVRTDAALYRIEEK